MTDTLPERLTNEGGVSTRRVVSPGAEQWLYRPVKCLDRGFVYLVDYEGSDESIVQAARVSYGKGTKRVSEDRGLIRYLARHAHTTPFEMVEFKFHCKMPIFVARQWIRHRTASVNEYSGRYSEMSNEFYLPDSSVLRRQSQTNKQGRGEELTSEQQELVINLLRSQYETDYQNYQSLLQIDLAKELARIGLSVANYTEWYWKIDLHNLMHFLCLRLDAHAQYEIRIFAEAMARIVKDAVPIAFEAFEDYRLYAITLSRLEIEFIKSHSWPLTREVALLLIQESFGNKREAEEAIEKFKKLGFVW